MRDSFHDLETFSPTPIQAGSHKYAEKAEVMLWPYALGDGPIKVWDLINKRVHWQNEISEVWEDAPCSGVPVDLDGILNNQETLVWFQNGHHFDFTVLKHAQPKLEGMIGHHRRRDTMVQAFSHALPGALEKLGDVLNISEDKRKIAEGKKLVRLFCMPQGEDFVAKFGTDRATKQTHPAEWQRFIQYAGGDIVTMREAHRLMPTWNYKGKQIDLCLLDAKINARGFAVDIALAEGAVRAAEKEKAELARQTRGATNDAVGAATQRDELLAFILAEYGVELPNMQSDTLERRLDDPDLPDGVKELIRIRLQASRNTAAKYKALLKSVSGDGRLRGCMQFRGAGRTGRWAHRRFQPGNLMRPTMPQNMIDLAIEALKTDTAYLIFDNVMEAIGNTVRGAIVAPPGKKLVVADLSNIEGRVAAWLAGEDWKLEKFREFDASLVLDLNGKPLLNVKGERQFTLPDLYIVAYAKSFNVDPESVPKKGPERQIGKVEELMFQYGGGVGAWLTGAATYGIDLGKMTEQVWGTLPEWAKDEAASFLEWLYEKPKRKHDTVCVKYGDPTAPEVAASEEAMLAACAKARFNLPERTFIACDAIKRLWRKAHPAISNYWKQLEDTIVEAISTPGVTLPCRKVKIRRDGAWLRIGLPSGRALCYPNPKIHKDGSITYTGYSSYSRKWGEVHTYGGKIFENITQAVACDQFAEPALAIEAKGYALLMGVHDEWIAETPDTDEFTADELASMMCADLGWNAGLPLAAAGAEMYRYVKEQ